MTDERRIILSDDLPTSLDTISSEFVNSLPHELNGARDKTWTKAVKRVLLKMGKDRGLFVCCHGSQDQGEWLLDLLWMNSKDWRILLAVESEWGEPKEIEEDFGKLMAIKARRKLLLFSTKNHTGADLIMERIERAMLAYPYHLEGEEYMALEVTAAGAYRYYFKVPGTGTLESASFNEMVAPLRWPWAK